VIMQFLLIFMVKLSAIFKLTNLLLLMAMPLVCVGIVQSQFNFPKLITEQKQL